ncbi:MAG: hypothetical protein ABI759_10955 [Candidatus Solibacter sp.]
MTGYRIGEHVEHPTFGPGIVLKCDEEHVEIDFRHAGVKTLAAAFALRVLTVTSYRGENMEPEQKVHSEPPDGPLGGHAYRDSWEFDMTTPNTPLYRNGRGWRKG